MFAVGAVVIMLTNLYRQVTSLRYRRIIAKAGTGLLTAGGSSGRLDLEVMASLVGQVARLHSQGVQVVLVTSGAIAAGRHRLSQLDRRTPARRVKDRQVLAAVGQSHLMHSYDQLFAWHDMAVAQTLLTRRDLADRGGYLNARNTLLALLDLGVVPVVNENDVVAVEEIEGAKIGDNDTLSALVANLVDADLLAILTDIDGLYTADPRTDPSAQPIRLVERIDSAIEQMARATTGPQGTGGMATKIQAARLATAGGADVIITDGRQAEVLLRLARGEHLGTLFPATVDRLESRKRWMLAGLSVKGRIIVDDGAAAALCQRGKSLLAAGIHAADGDFHRGDVVSISSVDGRTIAYGLANYSAADIAAIKGRRSDCTAAILGHDYGPEVVHRNNLVLV